MVDGWRSDTFYEARRDELEKRVGPRRFKHSLGVSETAEKLARVYGADETAARVAGLLHDWDKGYDDPGILARVDELGMELDAELVAMPRVLHGLTAAVALGRAFPELSPEVLTAVERHTLGDAGMSDLDMIVYIADALEPGRKGKVVEKLREDRRDRAARAVLRGVRLLGPAHHGAPPPHLFQDHGNLELLYARAGSLPR